ncbi:MAG: sigma-54 interaction domain-containing protein [Candidatus Aminicenantaceae bacterium]
MSSLQLNKCEIISKKEGNKFLSLLSKHLDIIHEIIPTDRALAILVDGEGEIVFSKAKRKGRKEEGEFIKNIVRRTLEIRNPIIINNLKTDLSFKNDIRVTTDSLERVLCLPLFVGERAAGVIYLERKSHIQPFSPQDLEFLIAFSKPLSLILKYKVKYEKAKHTTTGNLKDFFIGRSNAFHRILSLIEKVKNNDAPVFILGESGTGKELVARAIHFRGTRKRGKFVVVNCGAIPEHLLEAELFGYTRGSFTGAIRSKPGIIEEAGGGTFFLDEIGDLPLHLQAKLLRLLQEKEIRRIGENTVRYIDVRIISATNKNIDKEVERRNFREDLYYRLKIITIEIPPLRERKEDLLPLLNHFIEKYCREMNRERVFFSPRALELLIDYNWPGNIRELQNEVQRCLIFTGENNFIREECLSSKINPKREIYTASSHNFFKARASFERRFLTQALERCNYKKVKTAEEIGLTRQGLLKLMKKHNIATHQR